jgi:hypothetical protein
MRRHALAAAAAFSLAGGAPAVAKEPRPIEDNSFLLEEAYNQEPGVIQHVGAFHLREGGELDLAFTEEWPVLGQRHQASATVELQRRDGDVGVGDVLLHWRVQVAGLAGEAVSLAPRLSLVVPAGDGREGFGSGGWGGELGVPLSVAAGPVVSHTNVAARWIPSSRSPAGDGDSFGVTLGEGLVWLLHPKLNLLAELRYELTHVSLDAGGSGREEALLVSPGVRGAIDLGALQIVPGVAVPLGIGPSSGERGVFVYLSLEHPITRSAR